MTENTCNWCYVELDEDDIYFLDELGFQNIEFCSDFCAGLAYRQWYYPQIRRKEVASENMA